MLSNTRWCSRQLGDDNASTAKTIKSPTLMAAPNLQPTPANRVSENARTSSALSVFPSGRGNDDSTGGTYGDSSQMIVGWVSAELPIPANGRGSLGDAESWLKPSGSPALAHPLPPPLRSHPWGLIWGCRANPSWHNGSSTVGTAAQNNPPIYQRSLPTCWADASR